MLIFLLCPYVPSDNRYERKIIEWSPNQIKLLIQQNMGFYNKFVTKCYNAYSSSSYAMFLPRTGRRSKGQLMCTDDIVDIWWMQVWDCRSEWMSKGEAYLVCISSGRLPDDDIVPPSDKRIRQNVTKTWLDSKDAHAVLCASFTFIVQTVKVSNKLLVS